MVASPQKQIFGFKNLISYVISPIPKKTMEIFFAVKDTGKNLKELFQSREENVRLREKLREYIHKKNQWLAMEQENLRLSKILNLQKKNFSGFVPAKVIARDLQNWYHCLIVDKGSSAGIKKDSPVVKLEDDQELLIGRIEEVYPSTSKLLLITDSLCAVVGTCYRTGDDGVVKGENSHKLVFHYVPSGTELRTGDLIVSAGIGGIFPEGLQIGLVREIEEEPKTLFRLVWLEPFFNAGKLREVLVLREK